MLTVPDQGFLEHFGDEPAWASARSFWWLLLDTERVRLAPSNPSGDVALHAPWQGALDLLAFGKGWVHIGVELGFWREAGYPKTDPILRFIATNFGDSIAYLELYLKLYPVAEAKIRRYLDPEGREGDHGEIHTYRAGEINDLVSFVRGNLLDDENSLAWPAVRAFMPWILTEPRRVFKDDDLGNGFPQGGWDEGHVFAHFAHDWWGEPLHDFETGDSIEMISDTRWRVEFGRYTDWYLKLNNLLSNDQLSNLNAEEPRALDVFVHGVGYLGAFEKDIRSGRMIRQVPADFTDTDSASDSESLQVLSTTSPRFGFTITGDMARELVEANPHEIHASAESLEMLGRDGVEWIYSFGWGANSAEGTKYWSRHDGEWSEYHPIVEGIKFTTFVQAAIAGERLDLELPLLDAVFDDSTVHDIQPWAAVALLAEWDKPTPFPRLYAELGSMWDRQPIIRDELEPEVWALLEARVREIFPRPKPQGQTESELDLFQLVFNNQGEMTAKEVLSVLLTGERA